jgi:hypothetical protein
MLLACTKDDSSHSNTDEANTATIEVISGNGRLAGGERYEIAQWRSGKTPSGPGYFADFRGQDGGPTLDLRLKGLDQKGEFACGEAMVASLELRVDVANAYRAAPDAPCVVQIKRLENGHIEGLYTATLRHTGNPADEMTVAGRFSATQAEESTGAAAIKAAQAPKLGVVK